jgi:hypothetical protein
LYDLAGGVIFVGRNMPIPDAPKPDVSAWWDDGELQSCPQCGENKLVPPTPEVVAAHLRVCAVCGVVPGAEPFKMTG